MPSALEVVIELSEEDEPIGSTPLVGVAPATPVISNAPTTSVSSAVPNIPRPSTPCTVGRPDTSHDEEIARKLFVKINHEGISILGDGGLMILSSNDEEEATEEKEANKEEEEVKDELAGSGSPLRNYAAPISLASPLMSLVTIGGGACPIRLRLGF